MHRESRIQDDSKILHVHLVSHSHDDVGWLKTYQEYFDGSNDEVSRANVEVIIDSMVSSLLQDNKRRFTQVEIKFFAMWWEL